MLNQLDLMAVAPAPLAQLARQAGETVTLAVPDGDDMVCIHRAEGPGPVKVSAHLGTRRPISSSSLGKAYLAGMADGELERWLAQLPPARVTERSITDPSTLRAEVLATRARGYSIEEEVAESGVSCVSAAVCDHTGRPIAAISIAGPSQRMPGKRSEMVSLLLSAANDISKWTRGSA